MVALPVIEKMVEPFPGAKPVPYVRINGVLRRVKFGLMPGSQVAAVHCPHDELLIYGNRGGGKTRTLLYSFLQTVGTKFGPSQGVLFRRNTRQFTDIELLGKEILFGAFPGSTYNSQLKFFDFPDGSRLRLAYYEQENDFNQYLGSNINWIGWDELSMWNGGSGSEGERSYRNALSLLRPSAGGMKSLVRATTNPCGPGWIKNYWQCPIPKGKIVGPTIRNPNGSLTRIAIRCALSENLALKITAPDYAERMLNSVSFDKFLRDAWVEEEAEWISRSGGLFDEVWSQAREHCLIPPLFVNYQAMRLSCSYDAGDSSPFAIGWFAQVLDSIDVPIAGKVYRFIKGDIILLKEWWGARLDNPDQGINMASAKIAQGILEREKAWNWAGRVKDRVADIAIFNAQNDVEDRNSKADIMMREGVHFERSEKQKAPNSREMGNALLREMLGNTIPNKEGFRERPGFFVTTDCTNWLRTVPNIERDPRKPDDCPDKAVDHFLDCTRYRIRAGDLGPRIRSYRYNM